MPSNGADDRRVDQGIPVKRTIVAGVLLLAGVAGAAAADMPVPQAAPVPPPIYRPAFFDWSGVYVGVNGGYGFGQSNWGDSGTTTGNFKTNAFNIGGTLGVNYQTGSYVVGFEGDMDWSNLSATSSSAGCVAISAGALPAGSTCTTKQDWLGTARARIGYAFDRVFVFGTAGAAFGNERAIVNQPGAAAVSFAIPPQLGWTVGGGVEYAVTEAISVKADYLFVQFGTAQCPATIGCNNQTVLSAAGQAVSHGNLSLSESLVRLGVNYRFNW
jgi:outer membrane immunogenic protein